MCPRIGSRKNWENRRKKKGVAMGKGICLNENKKRAEDKGTVEKKKVKRSENGPILVHVKIHHSEGIDEPSLHPNVVNRYYRTIIWVKPYQQLYTSIVSDFPNPKWNQKGEFLLRNYPHDSAFLNVEVVRHYCVNEPSTSNGTVVVGRTRIPLPTEYDSVKSGRFGLVRDNGAEGLKPEGHIVVSMDIKRCIIADVY